MSRTQADARVAHEVLLGTNPALQVGTIAKDDRRGAFNIESIKQRQQIVEEIEELQVHECEGEEAPDLTTLQGRAEKWCNTGPRDQSAAELLDLAHHEAAEEKAHVAKDNRAIAHHCTPIHEHPEDRRAVDPRRGPPGDTRPSHLLSKRVDTELVFLTRLRTGPALASFRCVQLELPIGVAAALARRGCASSWRCCTIQGRNSCCPQCAFAGSVYN
mmetsp:Transcript_8941/g.22360  ORF Transcript_8941/g.22360 Transcript_8941/m.22360 type:complete len:216 (-) Transcript_8941:882-1529(-)